MGNQNNKFTIESICLFDNSIRKNKEKYMKFENIYKNFEGKSFKNIYDFVENISFFLGTKTKIIKYEGANLLECLKLITLKKGTVLYFLSNKRIIYVTIIKKFRNNQWN